MAVDFRIGSWEVDLKAREIRNAARTVRLERKAMGVLAEIARVAPEVMTSEELLERVWPGVIVGEGALYRVVAVLRKELGDDSRKPTYIESIPRTGYRLIVPVESGTQPADAGPGRPPAARRELGRIPVWIDYVSRRSRSALPAFASDVGRFLGWTCGAFRIIRNLPESGNAALWYVMLDIERSASRLLIRWELQRGERQELISSGEHDEPADGYQVRYARIAELVAEAVLQAIARQRRTDWHDGRLDAEPSYWDMVLLGDAYRSMDPQQIRAREDLLVRAIEGWPDLAPAHAAYANLLSWKLANGVCEDPRATLAALREQVAMAMDLDAQDPYVLSRCGAAFSRAGAHDEGVELCRRAFALAPSTVARDALAIALCFAGAPEEAIDHYRELLQTMPAGHAFQYGKLAVALTQCGRLNEALGHAERAVVHFPKDYFCWALTANLKAQLGDLAGARSAFQRARELMPALAPETFARGVVRTYGRTPAQREWLTAGFAMLESSPS